MNKIDTESSIGLRDPNTVMTLARLGSLHQCRLSFMRTLLRRMKRENWSFVQTAFDIDVNGVGHAVYTATTPTRSYSLVAFAHDLPPEQRSDRVIATAWDATFTLFDGIPTANDIERLSKNIPFQEAGRVTESELSVSRANRSVRLWEYVLDCLASGNQPNAQKVHDVGYLMRTTAVYGSGKLGAADREQTADRPEFHGPFQIEMLSVFLTRTFVMDLIEHLARLRSPDTAVPLDADLRHSFGIGNSTGLGMAPYLLNHPALINNWITARETALARVRNVETASNAEIAGFRRFLQRAVINAENWQSAHPLQIEKLSVFRADMSALSAYADAQTFDGQRPWDALWRWVEANLDLDAQEQLVSLLIEPYGALVDDLTATMAANEGDSFVIDGAMPAGKLSEIIEDVYKWAIDTDWQETHAHARVWYVSEEKLEPRLGEHTEEDVANYEQPLSPGRDAARLYADLKSEPDQPIADFLRRYPQHRHVVRRAQIAARLPYAEVRDNTISADMMPIDLLRAKLSFFGAVHFDPRSDRWVRINMFLNAPFPNELADGEADDWTYPPLPEAAL